MAIALFVAGGCVPAQDASNIGPNHTGMHTSAGNERFRFGEPADPGLATRTLSMKADDGLRFDPSEFEVRQGEIITFTVKNVGQIVHEFTLGDEAMQKEHADEMMGGSMMDDEANSVLLQAGETKSITWKFTKKGKVLFGCHQPGHYEAGMVGTITVS